MFHMWLVLEVEIATTWKQNVSLEIGIFSQLTTGLVMTSDQHDSFQVHIVEFFMGIDYEDTYAFIVDCFSCFIKWI